MATINFLVAGGDGYTVFTQGANKLDTGLLDIDVTTDYITAHSPVSPQVEGRIVVGGTLPGAAAAPGKPAQLPNTGGDLTPLWLLAALGASAMGAGARLRGRARQAQPAAAEIVAEETIEEEIEVVG